ncbi:hypothetical protein [Ralstonia phage RSP15]|uniref:hypothetical protein n=1 Tax=Ralstonia phage RSP15 TaxID=1785960 RepID=UPI00074D4340|nr:hypothetical protein BH754_gp073 [Ralstonia phage RSP15]BAU40031.1 hypothetical protein [Ralstonia phage RSP15]
MMSFFSNFGQVAHTLPNGEKIIINNITKWATIEKKYRYDPRLHISYTIKDNETPEILSNRLYGSVRFWWTVLILNDISDMFSEWPLSNDALDRLVYEKYWGLDPSDTHHYEDAYGDVIDPYALWRIGKYPTPYAAISDLNLISISNYEHEYRRNEQKKNIKLIDPDYISNLERELVEAFVNDNGF